KTPAALQLLLFRAFEKVNIVDFSRWLAKCTSLDNRFLIIFIEVCSGRIHFGNGCRSAAENEAHSPSAIKLTCSRNIACIADRDVNNVDWMWRLDSHSVLARPRGGNSDGYSEQRDRSNNDHSS